MSTKPAQTKPLPVQPRKDTKRETRDAVVADASKTEVDDRDLIHGEGGTLGLGKGDHLKQKD
jgi:hypothetical protein